MAIQDTGKGVDGGTSAVNSTAEGTELQAGTGAGAKEREEARDLHRLDQERPGETFSSTFFSSWGSFHIFPLPGLRFQALCSQQIPLHPFTPNSYLLLTSLLRATLSYQAACQPSSGLLRCTSHYNMH